MNKADLVVDFCMVLGALYLPCWCLLSLAEIKPKHLTKAQQKKLQAETIQMMHEKAQRPHVTEPYDTKTFQSHQLDFDIPGFWSSYTRQHRK